jgi:hypothetical protein
MLISEIDPEEIKAQCAVIKQKGIHSVVVVGIFSPMCALAPAISPIPSSPSFHPSTDCPTATQYTDRRKQ